MSHTYAQNLLHIVFSTKERRLLIPREFQPRMWSYVGGICKADNIFVHAIGGMEDHIHLLMQLPPVLALAKAVATIKATAFFGIPGWRVLGVYPPVVPRLRRSTRVSYDFPILADWANFWARPRRWSFAAEGSAPRPLISILGRGSLARSARNGGSWAERRAKPERGLA